jgi:hypothetical protein
MLLFILLEGINVVFYTDTIVVDPATASYLVMKYNNRTATFSQSAFFNNNATARPAFVETLDTEAYVRFQGTFCV